MAEQLNAALKAALALVNQMGVRAEALKDERRSGQSRRAADVLAGDCAFD